MLWLVSCYDGDAVNFRPSIYELFPYFSTQNIFLLTWTSYFVFLIWLEFSLITLQDLENIVVNIL